MKISTKTRYGLRAMLDLAVNSAHPPVSLSEIAKRQDISENYLEQIFSALRKAKLVKSVKGASGGYVLVPDPQDIRVIDIISELEGELAIIGDSAEDSSNPIRQCLKEYLWDVFEDRLYTVLSGITLKDLADEYRHMCSPHMFYI
ncbi:MAG TPA: RrF2 family transcriptional regulator [Clostridia bacterium]|nr:RrF2 family transcriptional regulator [Clostridia bacterium]